MRESDLSKSVNAKVLSNKLKNLRWLTHHYPNDPNYEIKNLIETMKIIEKDNRKKMIVTDYQFLTVELSMRDNSSMQEYGGDTIFIQCLVISITKNGKVFC